MLLPLGSRGVGLGTVNLYIHFKHFIFPQSKLVKKSCKSCPIFVTLSTFNRSALLVWNFWVASCSPGILRVLSYNSTSLWVASSELILRLWVGIRISLRYIKSLVSIYIISSLYVKQSKRKKVIMINTWEQL